MFACPTRRTDVSITVGNSKNNEAVGIDDVSAEVLTTLLPVIIFILIEPTNLFLSRDCFPKCQKDANVYLSHKLRH